MRRGLLMRESMFETLVGALVVAVAGVIEVVAVTAVHVVVAVPAEEPVAMGIRAQQRVVPVGAVDVFDALQRVGVAPGVGGDHGLEIGGDALQFQQVFFAEFSFMVRSHTGYTLISICCCNP